MLLPSPDTFDNGAACRVHCHSLPKVVQCSQDSKDRWMNEKHVSRRARLSSHREGRLQLDSAVVCPTYCIIYKRQVNEMHWLHVFANTRIKWWLHLHSCIDRSCIKDILATSSSIHMWSVIIPRIYDLHTDEITYTTELWASCSPESFAACWK